MRFRTLGKTGLRVSELSLGGLFVSDIGGNFDQTKASIHRALELGTNYIDTAPAYRNSEQVLGEALEGIDRPCILSTKLGGKPVPFDPKDTQILRRSVERSLSLLKRDCIDILMIHEPDRPGQYDWWTDHDAVEGPVLELLEQLKREGVIRFTGLGGTTTSHLAHIIRTGKFDVVLTAFNYSLLWREAEIEVIPAAKEMNMGIVIGSPLQQGALAQRYDDVIRQGRRWLSQPRRRQFQKLYEFLDELNMPIAELAMRFVISNPFISTVLTGSRSAQEVEMNYAAVEKGPLPDDILERLDEITSLVPFRPFGEPFLGPLNRSYSGPGRAG